MANKVHVDIGSLLCVLFYFCVLVSSHCMLFCSNDENMQNVFSHSHDIFMLFGCNIRDLVGMVIIVTYINITIYSRPLFFTTGRCIQKFALSYVYIACIQWAFRCSLGKKVIFEHQSEIISFCLFEMHHYYFESALRSTF